MDARVPLVLLTVVCAFAGAYALSLLAAQALRRRRSAMAAQGEPFSLAGLAAWRLRNGYKPAMRAAGLLLRAEPVRGFCAGVVDILEQRGLIVAAEPVLSVLMVVAVLLGGAVFAVTGSIVGCFACVACIVAVLVVSVNNARDKRQEEIRDSVPDALESMAACFGSGFTLLQTFRQVAEDTDGALSKTFARSVNVLEMGGSARQALVELKEGSYASELAFVAVALDVQHQSGGAMRQVLDAASDTVKGELALRRTLRVQTAQAKLSARVVVIMPFILVAAFSLATPDFLAPFFSGPLGYALLSLAIIMQVGGVLLVRRALAVDGVS